MQNKIKSSEFSSSLPINEVSIGVDERDNIVDILEDAKKKVRESDFKDTRDKVITDMLDDVTDYLKNKTRLVFNQYNSSNSINNIWCIEDVISTADDNNLDVEHLKRNDFLQILGSFQNRLEISNEYAYTDLAEEIENHLDDMEVNR